MASLTKKTLKRIKGDIKLLKKDPLEHLDAIMDTKDPLVWYFLVKGPDDSDFKGGFYLGKILLHPTYPDKPGDFMMLTPNGRFLIDRKICLSNTAYHSNEWTPAWNLKLILLGFLSIMLDDKENGISHIHDNKTIRKKYAEESMEYNRVNYPDLIKKFTRLTGE